MTGGITGRRLKDTKKVDGKGAVVGWRYTPGLMCRATFAFLFAEAHWSQQTACFRRVGWWGSWQLGWDDSRVEEDKLQSQYFYQPQQRAVFTLWVCVSVCHRGKMFSWRHPLELELPQRRFLNTLPGVNMSVHSFVNMIALQLSKMWSGNRTSCFIRTES